MKKFNMKEITFFKIYKNAKYTSLERKYRLTIF